MGFVSRIIHIHVQAQWRRVRSKAIVAKKRLVSQQSKAKVVLLRWIRAQMRSLPCRRQLWQLHRILMCPANNRHISSSLVAVVSSQKQQHPIVTSPRVTIMRDMLVRCPANAKYIQFMKYSGCTALHSAMIGCALGNWYQQPSQSVDAAGDGGDGGAAAKTTTTRRGLNEEIVSNMLHTLNITTWDIMFLVDTRGRTLLHYLAMAGGTASAKKDVMFWECDSNSNNGGINDPLMQCVSFLGNTIDCFKPPPKAAGAATDALMLDEEGDTGKDAQAKAAAAVGVIDANKCIKAGWIKKKRGGSSWQQRWAVLIDLLH